MKQNNKLLKLVYNFFLGLLLVLFVGPGINTFYPGPVQPKYPVESEFAQPDSTRTPQETKTHIKYQTEYDTYQQKVKQYNRNVSIITLVAAVGLLAVSLLFQSKLLTLSDGVMLGGLFSLVYSIIRAFISEESKYVFAVVTISLIAVVCLGYRKFLHDSDSLPVKTRKR